MTKSEVVNNFVEFVLPTVPYRDYVALAMAWNDYTDGLCKNGEITDRQYSTWTHPRISKRKWAMAQCDCSARLAQQKK